MVVEFDWFLGRRAALAQPGIVSVVNVHNLGISRVAVLLPSVSSFVFSLVR